MHKITLIFHYIFNLILFFIFIVILVVQNLFYRGLKCMTDIVRNSNYIFLMNSPQDKLHISHLASHMFPGKTSAFLSAYNDSISHSKYSPLLLDCRADTPDSCRIRSQILSDSPTVCYTLIDEKKII